MYLRKSAKNQGVFWVKANGSTFDKRPTVMRLKLGTLIKYLQIYGGGHCCVAGQKINIGSRVNFIRIFL